MDPFNPKRFSLGTDKAALAKPYLNEKPPHHKSREKFLKGPIPLSWLAYAARLPGKALHVGVVLWFYAGLKHSRTVALPNTTLRSFGVNRNAKYRALTALQNAGLIEVEGQPGCNPRVTLLDTENPK
jgi:hypothetical protein